MSTAIATALVAEFDQEIAITRRLLERTPAAAASWKPHPKSMALGQLACHLAEIPSWGGTMLQLAELDIAPVGGPPYTSPAFESVDALVALLDRNATEARAVLATMTDEEYQLPWTMLMGGQRVFTSPRIGVARTWVLNHLVHHRGQFSVYLRLQDVLLPGIYGPSADDPGSI
ncbi:MAG: DinB family protein [Gemmatimonadaceae bacterium]|nr:DinB family protein [Gemmatimonadaceae bacterium]